jgi:NitT/TauT family transport system substrate-binding protein/putative hydroxymethylpyrimidine transport system substrate-binding protein
MSLRTGTIGRPRPSTAARLAALGAALAFVVAACSSSATPAPSTAPAESAAPTSAPATAAPSAEASQTACTAPSSPVTATLILDYLPNAVHVPIYNALAKGYYKDAGIDLKIETPTSTSDTIKLMAAGKADFGITSMLDFLTTYQQDPSIKIFSAVEQSPLGSIVGFQKTGITRPKDLEGKLVGVTGVPSDLAALNSIVAYDGGDPTKVENITIGFNAVQNVVSGAVQAAIGFWNSEGVQLQAMEPTFIFRLDEYGAPTYPELVMFTRNEYLDKNACLTQAFVDATAKGYEDMVANPDAALQTLIDATQGLALNETKAQLDVLMPVFKGDAPAYGHVDMNALQAYLDWAKKAGILDMSNPPTDFATDGFTAAK